MSRLTPLIGGFAGLTVLAIAAGCGGSATESGSTITPVSLVTPTYVTVPPPATTMVTTTTAAVTPPAPNADAANETGTNGGTGSTAEETAATTTVACPTTYTVQEGDSVRGEVAGRFGLTYQEMDAANVNTPGYDNFLIGTEVIIPCPTG